jgi:hypothetical protein
VPAHSQIADVVKEDDTSGARRFLGIAQERANHNAGTPRLVDNRGAETVVLFAKAPQPIRKRTLAKIGTAAHDQPCRLTPGMGINDPYPATLFPGHHSLFVPIL